MPEIAIKKRAPSQLSFFDNAETPMGRISQNLVVARKNEIENFVEGLAAYNDRGSKTLEFIEDGIRYFVNEFWTSGQRKSHSIHEISYRACFKAQLPEFFISRLTKIGDVVFDPFMGRGTTLIQAALMGRAAYGNDVNPLSTLLTRPRL